MAEPYLEFWPCQRESLNKCMRAQEVAVSSPKIVVLHAESQSKGEAVSWCGEGTTPIRWVRDRDQSQPYAVMDGATVRKPTRSLARCESIMCVCVSCQTVIQSTVSNSR